MKKFNSFQNKEVGVFHCSNWQMEIEGIYLTFDSTYGSSTKKDSYIKGRKKLFLSKLITYYLI